MTPVAAPFTPMLYRSLIDEQLWQRLTMRIASEHDMSTEQAESCLDAALGYLKLCADHPSQRFAPSRQADIGWHTFMLYTRSYQEFCRRIAGRFLHHEPNDMPGRPMQAGSSAVTVAFMLEHNIAFNPEAWPSADADCTVDCDGGNGPVRNCTCC